MNKKINGVMVLMMALSLFFGSITVSAAENQGVAIEKIEVNTRSYIYTKNPPVNPYCEVKLYVTDSEDFEIYIGYTKLKDAMERK